MEDLNSIEVSDIVYLVEDNTILRLQVIRITNKQVILENNHKFWKKTGDKVGDISAHNPKIYHIDHPIVSQLYDENIDVYTVVEWLHQLKELVLTKTDLDMEELKEEFEELYELIVQYEDF